MPALALPELREREAVAATLVAGQLRRIGFVTLPAVRPALYAAYITGRLEIAAAATVWFLALVVPAAVAIERLGGARVGQL